MMVTTLGVAGAGATAHVSFSMPLGRIETSTLRPAMRWIGAAATSLTAENTTGQSRPVVAPVEQPGTPAWRSSTGSAS